jgi:hypothetical protein
MNRGYNDLEFIKYYKLNPISFFKGEDGFFIGILTGECICILQVCVLCFDI